METTYLLIGIAVIILFVLIIFPSRKRKTEILMRDNKRSTFRLSMFDKECTFFSLTAQEEVYIGSIRDISATGMRLISYEEVPQNSKVKVIFELDEDFALTGIVQRKKQLKNYSFDYGIQFTLDEETEQRLFKILWDRSREKVVL